MPTDLFIQCDPAACPVDPGRLKKLSNWLLKQCGVPTRIVSLVLVDDKKIRQLNKQYRNKDQATNVLSFPFAEGADCSLNSIPVSELLGDIIISVDTALRESIEYGQSFYLRISWLLTHGMLHLLGYDHEKSSRHAEEMFTKEKVLLSKLQYCRRTMMTRLAVNVDHVATIRQARGISEPDPVAAAAVCELAGASGIVVHLREDRRHIQDRDLFLLRQTVKTKLNLEMGVNKDTIKIALDLKPDLITLVPENRQELTSEGGLDIISQKKKIAKAVERAGREGIPVSIFSSTDPKQLKAAKDAGAAFVALHTGNYSHAADDKARDQEYQLIASAAEVAYQLGLRVFAGHRLNYQNIAPIAAIDTIEELSVGHAIIAKAVFTGLDQAVKEMLKILNRATSII